MFSNISLTLHFCNQIAFFNLNIFLAYTHKRQEREKEREMGEREREEDLSILTSRVQSTMLNANAGKRAQAKKYT